MKRAVIFVVVLWVLAIVVNAKADIYVVNHSSMPDATIESALPSFQQALDKNFGPIWGEDPRLVFGPGPPHSWTIVLQDSLPVLGAAGYHSVKHKVPYAVVDMTTRLNWQLVFTHELFEMLVDPFTDRATAVIKCIRYVGCSTKTFWFEEVGDPVEYTWYKINGVIISDFVTPAWFSGNKGPYDYLNILLGPHAVLHGGYMTFYTADYWYQLFNKLKKPMMRLPRR